MTITNIKTPNIYTDININTQRTGLLPNQQRILFISNESLSLDREVVPRALNPEIVRRSDERLETQAHVQSLPPRLSAVVDVYDTKTADQYFGIDSEAGRMMNAAIKTNRLASVQCLAQAFHSEAVAPVPM